MVDKIIQAQCRNILKEYDELLQNIIEEETRKMNGMPLGNSEFEITKTTIMNAGIREGMRKILAIINKYAQEDD